MSHWTHRNFWNAIDRLASKHDLTPSGLAIRAGLDPTALNLSKRIKGDVAHWLGTEAFFAILHVTNTNAAEFEALIDPVENVEGVFQHRHNELLNIEVRKVQNGWVSQAFSYAMLKDQNKKFTDARISNETKVILHGPYVHKGIPRLSGLTIAGQSKPIF